jgi:Uma2 family endonuclease
MPLLKKEILTTDYIYALPEGRRAELIDGVVYDMAPPGMMHQRLCFALARKIADYIDANGGKCEVFPSPFAVFLDADDRTYVEPDISVICDRDKITEKGCNGAPDFIVEIVSPASRRMDYLTKSAKYENAGVREYWIVDSEKKRTTIYRYEEDAAPVIVPFQQDISVGIYGDLSMNIQELTK